MCHYLGVEKENLCLYGHPNETWEVNLPAEEVPPELQEPALGINFARDGMNRRDWFSLVAVHSDCWLLSVFFYFGARLNRNESGPTVDIAARTPDVRLDVLHSPISSNLRELYHVKHTYLFDIYAEDMKAGHNTEKLMLKGNVDLLSYECKLDGGSSSGENKNLKKLPHDALSISNPTVGCSGSSKHKGSWVQCDFSATKVKRCIIKKLIPYLNKKFERKVEAVSPKNYDGSGVRNDKKEEKEVVDRGGGSDGSGHRKKKVVNQRWQVKAQSQRRKRQSEEEEEEDRHHDHDHGHAGYVSQQLFAITKNHGCGHRTGYVSPRHLKTSSNYG
ncbi:PHD finger protein ALFIN-LIKE 1 [Capsicum baccatum]|uniref:PHD finger protein ALFIN-LIKE n=1 Tax=Capsicum baccatum TaxID=33114 RepID=A0A2G2VUM7_CAPBA|nr:PHD finger protein ALFIN-LIKE 1 [Capsicum baccatum]